MSVKNLCYEFSDSSKPGHYQIIQELTWDGKDLKLEKQEVYNSSGTLSPVVGAVAGAGLFLLFIIIYTWLYGVKLRD